MKRNQKLLLSIIALCIWIIISGIFLQRNLEYNIALPNGTQNHSICIGILSRIISFSQRGAIRKSWLQLSDSSVYKFVVGTPECVVNHVPCEKDVEQVFQQLQREINEYHDILLVEASDDALHAKVLEFFRWTFLHHNFKLLIKTHDEAFVRLDKLVPQLLSTERTSKYWRGFVWRNTITYTSDVLYILSRDVIKDIVELKTSNSCSTEPQCISNWISHTSTVPIHDLTIQPFDSCDESLIVRSPLYAHQMIDLYTRIARGDNMCDVSDTSLCPLCMQCSSKTITTSTSLQRFNCSEDGVAVISTVTCSQRQLHDKRHNNMNFVRNGDFWLPSNLIYFRSMFIDASTVGKEWIHTGTEISGTGLFDFNSSDSCVELQDDQHVTQELIVMQTYAYPIVFSLWTKSDQLNVTAEVTLVAEISYTDSFGVFEFSLPTEEHNWMKSWRVFTPTQPIQSISLSIVSRHHKQRVWIDHVEVSPLNNYTCDMGYQQKLLPSTLTYESINTQQWVEGLNFQYLKKTPRSFNFIMVWTTNSSTWKLRHRRTIESILFHHPDATVSVYSNTLPLWFFHKFNSAGYDVRVIRYDISTIGKDLPGYKWTQEVDKWKSGRAFRTHLSDYLRFVVLYLNGGVYTDSDSILIRPVDFVNKTSAEFCDDDKIDAFCRPFPHLTRGKENQLRTDKFYLPIGFLSFEKHHPLIHKALSYFESDYDPNRWPCGTVFLTKAYTEMERVYGDKMDEIVEIWNSEKFYPIPWQQAQFYFCTSAVDEWHLIKNSTSYAVHLWGGVTNHLEVCLDSFMWRLLNEFSISDLNLEKEKHVNF